MNDTDFLAEAQVHFDAGRLTEAAAACKKGLRGIPRSAALHQLFGDVQQQQGRLDDAVKSYDRALAIDRGLHAAWYGSGCAWLAKKVHATALACFERAVAIAPGDARSHHNLGTAQYKLGLVDEAMEEFRTSLSLGDGFLPRTAIATSIPGSPAAGHRAVLEARRQWAETHLAPPRTTSWARDSANGRRLRIGYLSSFFESRNWMKPVWGLINHHDRRDFEIHLYSDCAERECAGCYDRQHGDSFHDITALSNREAADRIEQSGLDILIDLNGYSRVTRLAVVAQKPAPILVAWFNMYATSGIKCFDYLIGDEHVVLPEEEQFYTEKIVRVPGCYLTFDVRYPVPDVVDPPAVRTGYVTFGCLASQYKITPQVVNAWSRILTQVPAARLFLKNSTVGCKANRDHLIARFRQHGIASRRIDFEGPSEHFEFLAAYGQFDIALDTFPYNGGTTTSEALWQGVPVLTFRGDRWASRQSTSILLTGGLDDFVTASADEYVQRAVAMARDANTPGRLAALRRGMRSRLAASPLCDTAAFAGRMEALYCGFIRA